MIRTLNDSLLLDYFKQFTPLTNHIAQSPVDVWHRLIIVWNGELWSSTRIRMVYDTYGNYQRFLTTGSGLKYGWLCLASSNFLYFETRKHSPNPLHQVIEDNATPRCIIKLSTTGSFSGISTREITFQVYCLSVIHLCLHSGTDSSISVPTESFHALKSYSDLTLPLF